MPQERVCVAIVDVVTTRSANLDGELLDFVEGADPTVPDRPPLHAVACRFARGGAVGPLEAWDHPLSLGQTSPTLPPGLAPDLAVPLDLEASCEEACRALRIADAGLPPR